MKQVSREERAHVQEVDASALPQRLCSSDGPARLSLFHLEQAGVLEP